MNEAFTFPPLTSAYILDLRIQNAVNDLTGKTMVKGFDPAFTWDEFPEYVDTWLAAQQTVAEWCKAQAELWTAVWGNALGGTPTYARRLDTHDALTVGGISECWQDGWVARHVLVAGRPVSLVIHCSAEEASVQVEFVHKVTRAQRVSLALPEWSVDGFNIDAPSVKIREANENSASIDLTEMRDHAASAITAIQNMN